jgi:hypothetical protein
MHVACEKDCRDVYALSGRLDAVALQLARDPLDFRRRQGKICCFRHEGSIRSL